MNLSLLAILPVVHYYLHRLSIYTPERLEQFFNHVTVRYIDFLFIPFNALFHLGSSFTYFPHGILVALGLAIPLHRNWGRANARNGGDHLYRGRTTIPSFAGIAHVLFFTVQGGLVAAFFLSPVENIYTYWMTGVLLFYAVLLLWGSYRMHGRIRGFDLFGGIVLAVLCVLRFTPVL